MLRVPAGLKAWLRRATDGELRDVLRLVRVAHPGRARGFALLVVMRSLAPFTFAVATAVVVSAVPDAVGRGLDSPAGQRLLVALVAMTLAFIVQQTVPQMILTVGDGLGRLVSHELDQRLMRAALAPVGVGHLEDPAIADRLAAAQDAVAGWLRPGLVVNALAGRVGLYAGVGLGSLLLLPFHWWAAVAVLGLAVAVQARMAAAMAALGASQMTDVGALREAGYLTALGVGATAAKEVRVFGLGDWLAGRHAGSWRTATSVLGAARAGGQRGVWRAVGAMCLTIALLVAMLGWETAHQSLELSTVVLTLQGLALVTGSISDSNAIRDGVILGFARIALGSATSLEHDLTAQASRVSGGRTAEGVPAAEIRLSDVGFHYPGEERDILSRLDLQIPAGTSLGIVGLNGAGKTTLLKLLCRMYEPTAGAISVDGVDLRDIDPLAWQRRIAAIFQDYVRYPLSLADNVTLGPRDVTTLEQVAASVGLTPLVRSLPRGWDTPLVSSAEGGVDLSGGQWQRVALARALYAAVSGASVLVLDEPTASLDVRGEAAIYEQFLQMTAGRSTILISHRLSSVRRADRIAVLEQGRIMEIGSHAELMRAGGRYADLFRLQAAAFDGPSPSESA